MKIYSKKRDSKSNTYIKKKKADGRRAEEEWHLKNDTNKRLEESLTRSKGNGEWLFSLFLK